MPLIVAFIVVAVIIAAIAGGGGNGDDATPTAAPTQTTSTSSATEEQAEAQPAPDRAHQQAQASPNPVRSTPTRATPPPRAKTTQEKINDCLYRSRLDFERQIRERLNDPDSMKTRLPTRHGTTVHLRNEVRFELDYTARNTFGGTERTTAVGMLNIDTCRVRVLSYGW